MNKNILQKLIMAALSILDGGDPHKIPRVLDQPGMNPVGKAINDPAQQYQLKVNARQSQWLRAKGF